MAAIIGSNVFLFQIVKSNSLFTFGLYNIVFTQTIRQNKEIRPFSRTKSVNFNSLNDVQIGLLRMFSRPMTEEQTLKIKRAIGNHLSKELDEEVEIVVLEKGITEKDYDKLRKQHQRTSL
jgi:hypothetical protein